jgi:Complex1_LYR-like
MSGKQRAISLYRNLLKAHKNHLPPEMRHLGDTYVKSEFKLHKKAKPEHLTAFFREWEKYLHELLVTARTRDSLSMGAGVDPSAMAQTSEALVFGRDLPKDIELQEEQRQQLEALKVEAEKLGKHGK